MTRSGPQPPGQREIWHVSIPGQPDHPPQPRPALIVSEDIRNLNTDDVIVVPIFTRGRLGLTRVSLTKGMGGIAHDSVLLCEEITTLDRDFLHAGPLGGLVPLALLDQVRRAVRRALGEIVLEPS